MSLGTSWYRVLLIRSRRVDLRVLVILFPSIP